MSERKKYQKYLVVHADDLGMCHAVNSAIFKCFESGAITSASVMVPCSWFPEVAIWSKENPQYDLGVHITLTSEWKNYKWRPLVNCQHLVDNNGYFFDNVDDLVKNMDQGEIELEVMTQVETALKMGLKPSHVDSHMFVAKDEVINAICVDVAHRYGLPFVSGPFIIANDYGNGKELFEYYDKLLSTVDGTFDKVDILLVHPGFYSTELHTITKGFTVGNAYSRYWDYVVIRDKRFKDSLKKYNITTVSFKQVQEMKKCV